MNDLDVELRDLRLVVHADQRDDKPADGLPELDADLIRALAERLSKEGVDSARLRSIVAQAIANDA